MDNIPSHPRRRFTGTAQKHAYNRESEQNRSENYQGGANATLERSGIAVWCSALLAGLRDSSTPRVRSKIVPRDLVAWDKSVVFLFFEKNIFSIIAA